MNDTMLQWQANQKFVLRSLRTIFFAVTAVSIFGLFSTNFITKRWDKLYSISLIFSYILGSVYLLGKFIQDRNSKYYITIENGTVYIPRLILRKKEIKISEIVSIERYPTEKSYLGILVGQLNKSPIFVPRSSFNFSDDFDSFTKIIGYTDPMKNEISEKTSEYSLISRQLSTSNYPVAIISLIFVVIYVFSSYPNLESINNSVLANGSLQKTAIQPDQAYRIFSSFFLHLSLLHLGINVLSFSIIARHILVLFGLQRLLNVFLVSAIGGAVASLYISKYEEVVGASGGILGLLGAYTSVWIKCNAKLPGSLYVSKQGLIFLLMIQFASDAIIPEIDIYSHMGGYISGLVYGFFICMKVDLNDKNNPFILEKFINAVLLSGFIWGFMHILFTLC